MRKFGIRSLFCGRVTSFEALTLRLSGMCLESEYELVCKGETAEVTRYFLHPSEDGGWERSLDKRAICPVGEALRLLNDGKVLSWDGFHGAHPRRVKDGTAFTLKATLNGRGVNADGSQNFPPRFQAFTDGLSALLEAH